MVPTGASLLLHRFVFAAQIKALECSAVDFCRITKKKKKSVKYVFKGI